MSGTPDELGDIVDVNEPVKYIGPGKRKYYLARAELARNAGQRELAKKYEALAGALPSEADNE